MDIWRGVGHPNSSWLVWVFCEKARKGALVSPLCFPSRFVKVTMLSKEGAREQRMNSRRPPFTKWATPRPSGHFYGLSNKRRYPFSFYTRARTSLNPWSASAFLGRSTEIELNRKRKKDWNQGRFTKKVKFSFWPEIWNLFLIAWNWTFLVKQLSFKF